MSTIVTRTAKGSPLTIAEVDANFTNLNTDKAELASPSFTGVSNFAGNINLTGASKLVGSYGGGAITSNVAIGNNALNVNSSGIQSTALGLNALAASLNGNYNTAVGYFAMASNTSGSSNTAFGLSALASNTIGNYNVAIGPACLTANATGSNNIGIGQGCLGTSITASSNVSIGVNSLNHNYSGSSLVALGHNALNASSQGASQTAIGFQALINATSTLNTFSFVGGSGYTSGTYTGVALSLASGLSATTYPTANITVTAGVVTACTLATNGAGFKDTSTIMSCALIGAGTGFAVTPLTFSTAVNNTALGANAHSGCITGSNNVAIGYATFFNAATGSQNTALGYNAGRFIADGVTALVNVTSCTYIGMGSRASADGITNEIAIGLNAVGSGSNTATLGNSATLATKIFGVSVTGVAAPTIASAATIAPVNPIVFVSGTAAIDTITAPTGISATGGHITIIPTGLFSTTTAGNIALATAAVVGRAIIMTYDSATVKWYPSY